MIDSLSLKLTMLVSRISVFGASHVAPLSGDFETRTADVRLSAENESEIAYALPSGSKVTHGSEARSV